MFTPDPSQINLVVAADTRWYRTTLGGETAYVYNNDRTGAYYATDATTHAFLQELTLSASLAKALANNPEGQAQLLRTLPALVEAGLLEPKTAQPGQNPNSGTKPKPPLESRLAFALIEFLEIGWIYTRSKWLARWLFSRTGAAAFIVFGLLALNALLSNTDVLSANLANFNLLSPSTLISLTIVLLLLKAFHEIGHALAMAHFLETEGEDVPPIRAGVAFFFLLPLPFTNTTASWVLTNKWRRAAIGLAGIYFETWIAFIATLLWASIGESELQVFLLQIMIVSGASTLLFNLNPLIRLDGYYVLTDILDRPNLATRAGGTARQAGHYFLGAAGPLTWKQLPLLVLGSLSQLPLPDHVSDCLLCLPSRQAAWPRSCRPWLYNSIRAPNAVDGNISNEN